VLGEFGFAPDEIAELKQAKVVQRWTIPNGLTRCLLAQCIHIRTQSRSRFIRGFSAWRRLIEVPGP
jgi:hypothetical protein